MASCIPEPENPQISEKSVPNVVQFVNDQDGFPLAPAVNLPANVTKDALESLVNKLRPQDDDPVPFPFHIDASAEAIASGVPSRPVISNSINQDVLNHPSRAHTSPISCASFSPTGNLLATGSGDCAARLWDLLTETPSHVLSGHRGWVLCVEWEAMERKLATGGHDGHLWDPKTGKPFGEPLKRHSKWIVSLAWEPIHLNPTAPRLASSSKDGSVRVWSSATRRLEYTLGGHSASVNVVRWGGMIRIWDPNEDHAHPELWFVLRTGPSDHTSKIPSSDQEARSLALGRYNTLVSNSGELLISGSDDLSLFVASKLAAQKGGNLKPLARLTGHQRQVTHAAFSPDGRWAGNASCDNSVRSWDGKVGKFVAPLRGHVAAVYRLAWSAGSRLLASVSKDSTLKVRDLKTYKLKTDLPGHTDEVYCVDFVADKVASGGRDRTLKIWKN
ncbi:WD40 repeat-like protein [Thelephora ganbajun]|uniref:WD40 repeat-like protein n=1 Tax=Thelephora ganbajun TaxID=370292 RepID=A0ACB6Z380_THEGA|nr:WD40 repeat-like protein [Thelephora ganbajun]